MRFAFNTHALIFDLGEAALSRSAKPTRTSPESSSARLILVSDSLLPIQTHARSHGRSSWTTGHTCGRSHQLRAGVELRWNRLSGFFLPFYVGEFDFVAAGGRNAFENFLVNSPSQVQFTAGETVSHGSQVDHAYYFQDDVRLRPNLTLNLGIRLESLGQVLNTEAEKVLRRERDSASAFWLQSLSLAERTIPFLPRRFNVGPRAGLAWTPRLASWLFGKEQTVIRAGYAIAYDVGPDNLDADVLVSAPRVFFFICS